LSQIVAEFKHEKTISNYVLYFTFVIQDFNPSTFHIVNLHVIHAIIFYQN